MARVGHFRFSKALRLRQRREFLAVQKQGRRRRCRYLVVIALKKNEGPTRLGVTVSRKVGIAVVRNRVKRLIREAFRLHQHQIPDKLDLVVVAKREAREATYEEIEHDLLKAARTLGRKSGREKY